MTEELSNDAQTVRLITVNSVVVLGEHLFEEVSPKPVKFAETLANQAEELVVCPLLTATFDDH